MRRTGIITPAMELRRRGSLAGAILAWALAGLSMGYVFLAIMSIAGVSMFATSLPTVTTSVTQKLVPISGAFTMAEVVLNQRDIDCTITAGMQITLTANDGQTVSIDGNNDGSGWSFRPLEDPNAGFTQVGTP